ncbi:MAG TPA: DUF5916 domain-containing protein [Gemmatimonadales bacterium]|nr:DUF5916 domain-containing protein [Gemmatimonadales bacterium]
MPPTHLLAFTLLGVALPGPALAQSGPEPMHLSRLTGPIVLDGHLDDSAWAKVPVLPLVMYTPTFRAPLTERSEIRVAYDDRYIYLGARLHDSEPRKVRSNTLYRDRYSGDDIVALVLDTYNDRQSASWFTVNPAGNRIDRALSNDGEYSGGSDPMNDNWNAMWDVATSQSDSGWSAEMRIPFSSLGFQDVNGEVTMGLIAYRVVARRNERQIFPAIPPRWDLGFAKPSQSQRVVLEGVHSRRPVYVTPYGLGGLSWHSELDALDTHYLRPREETHEAGVDLKYSPTSNLALDLTANTDFAQVEADDQQVNLTRFSLFFPEKRQFFQERSAIFDFNTGGVSRLFHSRTIGLGEDGTPLRIYGGGRLVGRAGGLDVGFLDLQTGSRDSIPTENFGVLRLRRGVFNANSTIGTMITSRIARDGHHNVAAGADAMVRTTGSEYLTARWAQTYTSGFNNPAVDWKQSRMLLRWERRGQIGLSYNGELVHSGPGYDPGMGFTFRSDFTSFTGQVGYQRLVGAHGMFRTMGVALPASSYWRNADHSVESAEVAPVLLGEIKSGYAFSLTARNSYESVRDTFEIAGGAHVVPGNHWFHRGELSVTAPRSASFRPTFSISAGSFYDGTEVSFSARPAWNPSKHLELGVDYDYNRIRFSERNERLDLHLIRLRLQAALDVHASLATLLQHDNADHAIGVNARFRYNFRDGRDLWIVYNETMNTDRPELPGPRPPLMRRREFLVKYSYTIGM